MIGSENGLTDGRVSRRAVLQAGGLTTGLGVLGAAGLGMTGAAPGDTHTFLTQNAWLLDEAWAGWTPGQPDAADGDWLPREEQVKPVEKPALEERAREFGARLSYSDLDIVAFQEVFDQEQRDQISRPIQRKLATAVGPPQDVGNASVSSGLFTLAFEKPILETERMAFENKGSRWRDADAYARKGVLFTRIGVGDGAIDLFTTHLFAGGGWIGEGIPNPLLASTNEADIRRRQLEEFQQFVHSVKQTHDPDGQVPTVCAGDLKHCAG